MPDATATHLLVPTAIDAARVSAWAAIVSRAHAPAAPASAWIEAPQTGQRWALTGWQSWTVPDGTQGVVSARVVLTGLAARTRLPIEFHADGQVVAAATASTLPDQLPGAGERPFTVMLGSCFCAAEDKSGRLGRTFLSIPDGLRPDVTLLCGDQVYLDSPFYRFLLPHTTQGLAEAFLANYDATWGQSSDRQGFQHVLSGGSNLFTSDDHEFWNNAPFPSFSVNTLLPAGRHDWWELAKGLYSAFQTPESPSVVRTFAIGDLSMLVADTRITRSSDRTTFIDAADMARIVSWIGGLTAPGVLVVGQPLFENVTGWSGNVADWNLPDFEQYAALCRALLDAPQSILILTGDVHFGRVATATTHRGCELIEIISSPMSLVTGGGTPAWHAPPALFPAQAIPGSAQIAVTPVTTWQRAKNHFLTIELWQNGGRLNVRVRTWETNPDAGTPTAPVFEHLVQRSV
ncbi:MAG TPA: hypothetical protein VLT86_08720 [Vicinamibacterales bacterium]|nr:hypothetical protein [Vicinamibacterales bacterium]